MLKWSYSADISECTVLKIDLHCIMKGTGDFMRKRRSSRLSDDKDYKPLYGSNNCIVYK